MNKKQLEFLNKCERAERHALTYDTPLRQLNQVALSESKLAAGLRESGYVESITITVNDKYGYTVTGYVLTNRGRRALANANV